MNHLAVLGMQDLSWSDKVALLAYQLQAIGEDALPVKHWFQDEWYVRELTIPAGMVFIGRPHVYGHIVKLIAGRVALITEQGRRLFAPPAVIHTQPGFQAVCYTYTEIVCQTWHFNPDGGRDVRQLEDEHFSPVAPVLERGKQLTLQLLKEAA